MANISVTSFTMTAYYSMESYKHVQFTIFITLYVVIVSLNAFLIAVIYLHKSLHQPMNIFTCTLAFNGIHGGTALLPVTMSVLLSEKHELSLKWCLVQIFFLHTYASIELCILAVMGYDRYVAICFPLHYHSMMSVSKVHKLIALAWVYPVVVFIIYFSPTLELRFCERVIEKLYCVNMALVRNSCTNISHISIFGLVLIFFFMVPQLLMIIYSYLNIFKVCRKLPKESQAKALKTCIPHIVSVANYTMGAFFEIISSRFDLSQVAHTFRNFMSLYYIIIPTITNPALYGIGTSAIRLEILKLFVRNKGILPGDNLKISIH